MKVTAVEIIERLRRYADEKDRVSLMRFFKTGKGEYGEGDLFLGVRVPFTRHVVKEARLKVSFEEIKELLYSPFHEVRLAGFLLLAEEMKGKRVDALRRKEVADFYLLHAKQANNWDLVDLSSYKILGEYLLHPLADGNFPDRTVLDRLAGSPDIWEQRIAVVSTLALIRRNQFEDTLRIVSKLIPHPHDLIHKASGWMLREIGKRDKDTLIAYLQEKYSALPRTSLRYAIERLPEPERRYWLKRKLV